LEKAYIKKLNTDKKTANVTSLKNTEHTLIWGALSVPGHFCSLFFPAFFIFPRKFIIFLAIYMPIFVWGCSKFVLFFLL